MAVRLDRRSLLAASAVLPAVVLPVGSKAQPIGVLTVRPRGTGPVVYPGWIDFRRMMDSLHRDGARSADHAQAAGLKVADLYCVMLCGRDAPVLFFQGEGTAVVAVDASGVRP
jgi:hypothetical protein